MAFTEASSHWYRADGSACHTIPKKKGPGTKAVKITDARELGLFPSVTTVLKILDKPQLVNWKLKQVILAALTTSRLAGEDDDTFVARIIRDAFQQVEDAADRGKEIHAALEAHFGDQPYDPAYAVYVNAVDKWMQENRVHVIQRELRLVNLEEGYAGTTDLIVDSAHGLGVGDYKTRKSNPAYPMTPYDDQATQIAAYHQAQFHEIADNAAGFNLFISSTEPGRVEAAWYDSAQLRQEWAVFQHLCAVWRTRNKYDPRAAKAGA